ncbi:MAG: LacI family DNA-binding transcriptional regulator [Spirochaetales bacterium]|nr:LacI family DNA-binding transcriptional regulator [Spirochaetales bacterium]
MIEPVKKKYEIIAQKIQNEIEQGIWSEGEAILTVRELAKLYNVSPQTANKATAHLVGLGILSSRQGSGSIVTKRSSLSCPCIPMMIDSERAAFIKGSHSTIGYHGKELFLTYMNCLERAYESSRLIVYDKNSTAVSEKEKFKNATGLLIQGTPPPCYMEFIRENNIPAVLLNRRTTENSKGRIGSLMMDEYGLEQLCLYMATLGHNKILYCLSREFATNDAYFRRREIIRNCMDQVYGQDWELEEFHLSPTDSEDRDKLAEYKNRGYSAILCFNDISALRAYELLHTMKIRVPEEMSVSGFDDLFMANLAAPPLTTVKVDRDKTIKDALDLLTELMVLPEGSYPVRYTQTELVIRRSCWKSC